MITLNDYLGPWDEQASPAHVANAMDLLERVNTLMDMAFEWGIDFPLNPKTQTYISGSTLGGFRPQDAKQGAALSSHKEGRGVDVYDPKTLFAGWCRRNQDKLAQCGLYMEHPSATPGWVHLTTRAPKSGNRMFYV